jgi:hypothetical protein
VVLVTLTCGIAAALGRAEKQMVRAELSGRENALEVLGIADSWLRFWLFVVIFGAIGAVLVWFLGGWWYRVRLRWSGAADPGARTARLVYIYASFVQAFPTILIVLVATAFFRDYAEYWASDELWSSVGAVFPFWSCVASYKGATTVFELSQSRARLWFLVLPILVYVLAVGVIGLMYALLSEV